MARSSVLPTSIRLKANVKRRIEKYAEWLGIGSATLIQQLCTQWVAEQDSKRFSQVEKEFAKGNTWTKDFMIVQEPPSAVEPQEESHAVEKGKVSEGHQPEHPGGKGGG